MESFKTILGYEVDGNVATLLRQVDALFPNRTVLIHDMELFQSETDTSEGLFGPAVSKLNLRDYLGIWIRTDIEAHLFNAFLSHELVHFIQQFEGYESAIVDFYTLDFSSEQRNIFDRIKEGFTNFVWDIDNDRRLIDMGLPIQGIIDFLRDIIDNKFESVILENQEFLRNARDFLWEILCAQSFYYYVQTWRAFQHLSDDQETWKEYDRKWESFIHPHQYKRWKEILEIIIAELPRDKAMSRNLITKILNEILGDLSLTLKFHQLTPRIEIDLIEPTLIPI